MAYQYLPVEEARRRRRDYYLKHRTAIVRGVYERKVRLRHFIHAAKDKPCTDCKKKFPTYVMDFDHRPGERKLHQVGQLERRGSKRIILEEIAKCDVVCSNCHRIRTHERRANKQRIGTKRIREFAIKSELCGRSSVVERQLPKLNVVGSIPIARSRFSGVS